MDWPEEYQPYRWDFYLQNRTTRFESPITGTRQVLIRQGARWVGTGSFKFPRAKSRAFDVLLAKLRGASGTINMWDLAHPRPLGGGLDLSSITTVTYFTSPGPIITGFLNGVDPVTGFTGGSGGVTVQGGPVGTTEVIAYGFPQGTTQLLAGDYVGLGGYMYMLIEDAVADGLNRAVLYLNRPLIVAVSNGSTLVMVNPKTPMQLVDDDQPNRSITVGGVYEYTISFVEAIV